MVLMCALLCIVSVITQVDSLPPYYLVDTVASGAGVGSILSIAVDPRTGDQYFSGSGTYVISKVSFSGSVPVVFAGTSGTAGRDDGTGAAARFSNDVFQISYCQYDGNFYIADSANNILRQMTTMAVVRTIAGGTTAGSSDGVGTNALFDFPTGVACNSNNGDIIVSDYGNCVLRLVSSPSRTVTLFAGGLGTSGFADGMGTYARFSSIYHIAQNQLNTHFYLADASNNLIRQVTLLGMVSTFAGRQDTRSSGATDGLGTLAYFNLPLGISCDDASGNIIVGDYNNHRIRAIDVSTGLVSTIAGSVNGAAVNGIGTYTQVTHEFVVSIFLLYVLLLVLLVIAFPITLLVKAFPNERTDTSNNYI